jgi:F0F1-type ATP synthase membrane subunit c/vacuolar-type H+-ATPase subunit K
MNQTLKTLRMVQWARLGSIILYAALGVMVRPIQRSIDPTISYLFTTLAVAVVGAIFVVRRTLVFRAEASLARDPNETLSLNHWRTGYIVTYALCEALALFGLVQRFLGASVEQSVPYYLGGFVLLVFFRPRQPETSPTT